MSELHPWRGKVGVELTSTLAMFDQISDDMLSTVQVFLSNGVISLVKERIKEMYGSVPAYRLYNDGGYVEFATHPLGSWDEMKTTYLKVQEVFRSLGLTMKPRRWNNGGGHINLDVMSEKARTNMVGYLSAHPSVVWAFSTWYNNKCSKLLRGGSSSGGKGYCISLDKTRSELRFFEAAGSWEIQEEQIAFALALRDWCEEKDKLPLIRVEGDQYTKEPLEDLLEDFRKQVERFGLPKERYEKYEENIAYRCSDVRYKN